MGIKDIKKALKALDGASVEIGWFDSNRYNNDIPVAAVAAWNNLGTPTMPARPFMTKAIHDGNATVGALVEQNTKAMVDGNMSPDVYLHNIGLHYETAVVDSIVNGGWQKNADSTIAKKGFDAPLRDSKIMMQTVTHEISIKE